MRVSGGEDFTECREFLEWRNFYEGSCWRVVGITFYRKLSMYSHNS